MLKKQTVWLLTMLSLMIVLSVYYMNQNANGDLAFINDDLTEEETTTGNVDGSTEDTVTEGTDIVTDTTEGTASETDDLFTTIRMDVEESRSVRMEQLEEIVASSATSTEEKNEAYDEMEQIDQLSSKELIVEETLKADKGYQDVLVRTEDEDVIVTVKADELSDSEANNIMQTIYDEFGNKNVEVKFQPSN
ncbi:stage III sporulation protein AH [Paraliobacillus ryukyuensis]|uniref:Stage III sporulation protein AH n=1 Tax=Paraliobacillus ryukyuensis TaxID=200904 RepID=A0A366EG71_9BACI|nr:SpoIIIAH-like family protein [Paraliobacillus ryukyuensis]RBP01431.1 stage III sporulation protein AH [Paraliobacillus ryukyuensis]